MPRKIARYGWRPDQPDYRDRSYAPPSGPMPIRFIQGHSRPIQDQGQLGSCTGHGVERVLQNLRLKQGLPLLPLSRLQIYFDERRIEGTEDQDVGAEIRDGIKVVSTLGAIPEELWPYEEHMFADQPPAADYRKVEMAVAYQRVFYSGRNLAELKACLAIAQDPVVFGFSVYENFESDETAGSGFADMPSGSMVGGHCVVAEGFDDEVRGANWTVPGGVWVANSWGDGWGQAGYFWLPYGYFTNSNLSDDFWRVELVQEVG